MSETASGRGGSAAAVAARIERLFEDELFAEVPEWDTAGHLPASVFERLAATGAPTARFGAGDAAGGMDVAAALARACGLLTSAGAGISIMSHVEGFAGAARRTPLANELMDAVARGTRIGCVAISEATSGSDVSTCATTAERTDAGWRIDGHKHFVSNFGTATDCVVFARTANAGRFDDYTMFVVPTGSPGVRATAHELVGAHASGTVQVDFDAVEVGDERQVGEPGSGLRYAMEFLRLERFWAAVGAAASAELCLEMAIAFTSRRRIGGTALGSHQAIAHRLADMACVVASARAVADDLVDAARAGRLTNGTAAIGKLHTARAAWTVADEAFQLVGGRAYTRATPLARVWLDARLMRIGGGTDEVLRELIARVQRPGALVRHPAVAAVADAAAAGVQRGELNS